MSAKALTSCSVKVREAVKESPLLSPLSIFSRIWDTTPPLGFQLRFAEQCAANLPDYLQHNLGVLAAQTVVDTACPKHLFAFDRGPGQKHAPILLERI